MRLEGVAKAGWYPSPPVVVQRIARALTPPETARNRIIRLLDPCCGTGEAAATLAAALAAESFGVEINEERADAARRRLDHTLTASAFSTRIANGGFSVLVLNPPYDQDSQTRRLEHHFLTTLSRVLCPGGVLVYIVPQVRLQLSARYLAAQYEDLRVYRFPDEEYATFQQVVLFGRRKARPSPDPVAQQTLEALAVAGPAGVDPLAAAPTATYLVPALPVGDVLFASLHFDAQQAALDAQKRGCLTQPGLALQLWPVEEAPVRPLLPLRKGHLALLIAAGFLNNVALVQGEDRVLVKGRCTKELIEVDPDNPDVETLREVVRTAITVLDLRSGEVTRVENGR